MRKLSIIAFGVLLAVLSFWAGSWQARKTLAKGEASGRKILYYVDPMNPAHTSKEPGLAPCGMKMEPVYANEVDAGGKKNAVTLIPGTIRVGLEKQQLIGVRMGTVEKKPLIHNLRLLGKVATDETRIYRINATVDGWITKTMPVSAGSLVKKDETLAGFYSPEFLSAGQALLFALSSKDRVQQTGQETAAQKSQLTQFDINLKQYADALRNLGMGERQIQEMIETRKYMENVNITSPADGFILVRNVSDGQRFDKGTELFRIADLSHVWILVDVFERDASLVQPGQTVKVELPSQRKTFAASISKTLPQFDNISRTLKLRLEADNPEFALKPDMFVDIELPVTLPESLVIPLDAVLDSGAKRTVYVEREPGVFEPRVVQTGWRLGEHVQITEGLMPGEKVVVSGNFLLDSESRMKLAATGAPREGSKDPVCGMMVYAQDKAKSPSTEYAGTTYYFCCEACKEQFRNAPGKFIKSPPTATNAVPEAKPF